MMKKIIVKYTGLISISLVSFLSCTEIIPMEFTTDFERLVVDAQILDEDTVQYVKLFKINLDGNDDIVSPISDANVILSNGSTDVVFNETDEINGFYIAPNGFIGIAGVNYELSLTNTGVKGTDGTDSYFASAIMPNKPSQDSIRAEYMDKPEMGILGYWLKCYVLDPPERNYYLFKAWKNGVLLTDTLYEYRQTDDYIFNGTYVNGANCQLLQDAKEDEYVESGDTLTLEIDNIDMAYYDYLNSAIDEFWGSNPMFGGPPANITSNISNGAVGIFRVYSVSKSSVIVHEAIRE